MNKANNVREALQQIPSVDELIQKLPDQLRNLPHTLIKTSVRITIKQIRSDILDGSLTSDIEQTITENICNNLEKINSPRLQKVINGTGIVLHTGLGRAPISKSILNQVIETIYPYSNVELDISSGKRGERVNHVEDLLNVLSGSEASIVVNNNAAAVLIMLNTISEGKEVIISRGQQVEIGGSFRIPDVIEKSGCKMVEVGTTNKTHLKDYEKAINKNTGAILIAHTSNYKVIGFTKEVELSEIAQLAKRKRISLLVDLGSGAIAELSHFDLPHEDPVRKYVKDGAHLVSYSGDKLLGGPQSGIISGRKTLIKKIHQNPLYRAMRCDKFTFAILEKILRTYRAPIEVDEDNLTITLLKRSQMDLKEMGKKILKKITPKTVKKLGISFIESKVEAGSGSLPTEKISSMALQFNSNNIRPKKLSNQFRNGSIPVLGYIHKDTFCIDLKAIPEDEFSNLIKMIKEVG